MSPKAHVLKASLLADGLLRSDQILRALTSSMGSSLDGCCYWEEAETVTVGPGWRK
jgi:hypothetical protein